MYNVQKLFVPKTLEEALGIIASDPTVVPIAGGTDILVKMRSKNLQNIKLMSLLNLKELSGISQMPDGSTEIGANSTFTDIARNPLVDSHLPLLKTAALSMGGPQIQNVSTIGGNVCNGAVSADSAPSLFALNAELVLKSASQERTIKIADFYKGPGKVDRKPEELLIKLIIPAHAEKGWHSTYLKFSTRRAMDIATLGCAITCQISVDQTVERAAIALGVAGPVPVRCYKAEQFITGKQTDSDNLRKTAEIGLTETNARSSWRASKEYRDQLIKELIIEAFEEALKLK